MPNREEARQALDRLISKSRVHLYKPIQIAEILYHIRTYGNIDPLNLEDYRTQSKRWRDDMSLPLLGRVCTSSSKFQDDLFNANAIPPSVLDTLNNENLRTNGAVESYIYNRFTRKYEQLSNALLYCSSSKKETFDVKYFIDSFWQEAGLKRSLDKIYEIVVYALFSTLVNALDLQVEISIPESNLPLLCEFEDFTKKVMCMDSSCLTHIQNASIYRVGVTNAADRGLDMYSNWGPAIQIKHLSLDTDLAENIVSNISSDHIVIVCKDAEKDIISSLLTQIGWKRRIQSIITESDLILWYEKALRGRYAALTGDRLMDSLCCEIGEEFPSVYETPDILKNRHYETISDPFWI